MAVPSGAAILRSWHHSGTTTRLFTQSRQYTDVTNVNLIPEGDEDDPCGARHLSNENDTRAFGAAAVLSWATPRSRRLPCGMNRA